MEPYREPVVGAEVDRSVIVVALSGGVLGIDRLNGQIRWDNPLPGSGGAEVFIAMRYGLLVVSAFGDAVYRLDYATGQTLWQATTSAAGRASILIESDLIVVAKGGCVDGFDHVGRRWWQQGLRGKGRCPIALALPGNVVQADDAGT